MLSTHMKSSAKSSITQDDKGLVSKDNNPSNVQSHTPSPVQKQCEPSSVVLLKSEGIPFASVCSSELAEARKCMVADAAERNIREWPKSQRTETNMVAYEIHSSDPTDVQTQNAEDPNTAALYNNETKTPTEDVKGKEKIGVKSDNSDRRTRKKNKAQEKDQWSACLDPKSKKNEGDGTSRGTVKHFLESSDWKSSENPSTLDNPVRVDTLKGLNLEKEPSTGLGSFTGWIKALGRKVIQNNTKFPDSKAMIEKSKMDEIPELVETIKSSNGKEESLSKSKTVTMSFEENPSENILRSFSNTSEKSTNSEKAMLELQKSTDDPPALVFVRSKTDLDSENSKNVINSKNSENSLFPGNTISNSNPSFMFHAKHNPNSDSEFETQTIFKTESNRLNSSSHCSIAPLNYSQSNFTSYPPNASSSKDMFSTFTSLFATNLHSSQSNTVENISFVNTSSVKMIQDGDDRSPRENASPFSTDALKGLTHSSTRNSPFLVDTETNNDIVHQEEGDEAADAIRSESNVLLVDYLDNSIHASNVGTRNDISETLPNPNDPEESPAPVETTAHAGNEPAAINARARIYTPHNRMLDVIVPAGQTGSGDTEANTLEGNVVSDFSGQVSVHNEIQVVPFALSPDTSRIYSNKQSSDSQGGKSDEGNPFLVLEAPHAHSGSRLRSDLRVQHLKTSNSHGFLSNLPPNENFQNEENTGISANLNNVHSSEVGNSNVGKISEQEGPKQQDDVGNKLKTSDMSNINEKNTEKVSEFVHDDELTGKIDRVRERWIARFKGNATRASLPLTIMDEFEDIEKNDFVPPSKSMPFHSPDDPMKGEENNKADEAIYHFFNEMEKIGVTDATEKISSKPDFDFYNSFLNSKMCMDELYKANDYQTLLHVVGDNATKDFQLPLSSLLSAFRRNENGEMMPFDFSNHPDSQKIKNVRKWRIEASEAWSNLLTSENINFSFSSSLPELPLCKLTLSSKDDFCSKEQASTLPSQLQCYFCGLEGHDLLMCSETKDHELPLIKSRLSTFKSYFSSEEGDPNVEGIPNLVSIGTVTDTNSQENKKVEEATKSSENQNVKQSDYRTLKSPPSPCHPSPCLPAISTSTKNIICLRCLEEGHWGSECLLSVTEASAIAREKEKVERKSKEKIAIDYSSSPNPLLPSVNTDSPSPSLSLPLPPPLSPSLPHNHFSNFPVPVCPHPLVSSPLPPSREIQKLFEEIGERNSHCSSALRERERLSTDGGEGEEGEGEGQEKARNTQSVEETLEIKKFGNGTEYPISADRKRWNDESSNQGKRKERWNEVQEQGKDTNFKRISESSFPKYQNSLTFDEYLLGKDTVMDEFSKSKLVENESNEKKNLERVKKESSVQNNRDNNFGDFDDNMCASSKDGKDTENMVKIGKRKREETVGSLKEEKLLIDLNMPAKRAETSFKEMKNTPNRTKIVNEDAVWNELDFRVPCVSNSTHLDVKRVIHKVESFDLNLPAKSSTNDSSVPLFSHSTSFPSPSLKSSSPILHPSMSLNLHAPTPAPISAFTHSSSSSLPLSLFSPLSSKSNRPSSNLMDSPHVPDSKSSPSLLPKDPPPSVVPSVSQSLSFTLYTPSYKASVQASPNPTRNQSHNPLKSSLSPSCNIMQSDPTKTRNAFAFSSITQKSKPHANPPISSLIEEESNEHQEELQSKLSSLFFSSKNISHSLLQTFESIRLSRKDISKCSQHPDFESRANGYFLRLKFGKQPNSLELSGYKMAKICGMKKSISDSAVVTVTVEFAKIKYNIEEQYISNKPFTKDEVLLWWNLSPAEDKQFLFSKSEVKELVMRKKSLI